MFFFEKKIVRRERAIFSFSYIPPYIFFWLFAKNITYYKINKRFFREYYWSVQNRFFIFALYILFCIFIWQNRFFKNKFDRILDYCFYLWLIFIPE